MCAYFYSLTVLLIANTVSQRQYSYLYHDKMNQISQWEYDGNVSTISSLNCPSSRDNLCVDSKDHIINGIFTWSHFDEIRATDIYMCKTCINSGNTDGLYLYGFIQTDGKYYWQIGVDDQNTDVLTKCYVGNNITDSDYIFDIDDCSETGSWENDPYTTISRCPSTDLGVFQESKICITNSYDSLLDGEYIWSSYNAYIDGALYYNTKKNIYLSPYISNSNIYQYYIYGEDMHIYARCNISNHKKGYVFNVTDCFGNWELYHNDSWHIDSNIVATPCQDTCIKNSQNSLIDGTYSYAYFNRDGNTNVYKQSMFGGKNIYLYGVNSTSGDKRIYRWIIGDNPKFNSKGVYSYCNIGENLGNEYIFSLDECLQSELWKIWNGTKWVEDSNMTISKCNSQTIDKKCIELTSNSEIMRTYSVNKSYKNVAVGFDIYDFGYLETNSFQMEYSCGETNQTIMEIFNFDSVFTSNIVYNLESTLCNDAESIMVRFINENSKTVYMNDIYLYYDVNDIIFSDEMDDGDSNWIREPGNATAGYDSNLLCPSNGECYRMCTCTTNYVSISTTIKLTETSYRYKDLNLKWALNTDGLNNDSATFDVRIECDDFLCILMEYNNDCYSDKQCDIQSYNLPPECDYSSELKIKFILTSISDKISNVFIDYVNLSHSNPSENTSICIAPLSTTKYIKPTSSQTALNTFDYIIICVCSFVILMAIAFIIIYAKKHMKIASYIPVADIEDVSNPLVGIIAIGDYNNNNNVLESDLHDFILDDIPVYTDVENLEQLFKILNYRVIPNNKEIKVHWTEEEIITFLKEIADELFDESHNLKHDGLILCISAHGIEDHIVTSDFKTINKKAIHRCISLRQPNARDIPRIFLFDSCEGSAERRPSISLISDDQDETELKKREKNKYFGAANLESSLIEAWTDENSNPDFKLVEIHAANTGYQAKMNSNVGSYLMHQFSQKITENITKNKNMTLGTMFDAIQNELHDLGKQQIVKSFNNGTSFLRLKMNSLSNIQEDIIDLTTVEFELAPIKFDT